MKEVKQLSRNYLTLISVPIMLLFIGFAGFFIYISLNENEAFGVIIGGIFTTIGVLGFYKLTKMMLKLADNEISAYVLLVNRV